MIYQKLTANEVFKEKDFTVLFGVIKPNGGRKWTFQNSMDSKGTDI